MIRTIYLILAALIFQQPTTSHASLQWRVLSHPSPESAIRATIEAAFFINDLNGWAIGDNGTLLKTVDGGERWATADLNPRIQPSGIFFLNNNQGWIVGNHRRQGIVLQTADGGRSWQIQFQVAGFNLSSLHSIWFADEQNGWVVGEAEKNGSVRGMIFGTQDGGRSWIQQYRGSSGTFLHEVKFFDARHGWAVGDEGILYTSSGGREWRKQRDAEKMCCFGLSVLSATEAWVVGGRGVMLHTNDAGRNWEMAQLPTEHREHWLDSVVFVDSARGWVAGEEGAIFHTEDAGRTWRREGSEPSEYIRALAATNTSIFAVGNNGIILRRPRS